ncbi:hypothetical protein A5791_12115 [Mycobacterium sp. 852002-51163_SCH5372311]|nr:hypothetical protein A5791_12115 [Mycobacterium sp. 852002-51163_SCH5372311]
MTGIVSLITFSTFECQMSCAAFRLCLATAGGRGHGWAPFGGWIQFTVRAAETGAASLQAK